MFLTSSFSRAPSEVAPRLAASRTLVAEGMSKFSRLFKKVSPKSAKIMTLQRGAENLLNFKQKSLNLPKISFILIHTLN